MPPPTLGPIVPLGVDASFFSHVVGSRSVVLLGESLHGTDEFPRVRLPLLETLHARGGFDVLAVEGSMLDAWLAQDDLLRGGSIEDASRTGWLTLWDTEAMRAVLSYVHRSGMYLASMDIQPAMGPLKAQLVRRFVERIKEYTGVSLDVDMHVNDLAPLRTCKGELPIVAITRLAHYVERAVPIVRARSAMHADTLALIPDMLRQRLLQCAEAAGDGPFEPRQYWKRYKEARDRYQATNVLALRDRVSRTHRVVVWAHHSHVGYQAAGADAAISIGGQLKERIPNDVFALGVFGGSGHYLEYRDGPTDGIAPADVVTTDGLDALRALDATGAPFFVDLRRPEPRLAFAQEPRAYPLEGRPKRVVLAHDFDGVVFVPQISAAKR